MPHKEVGLSLGMTQHWLQDHAQGGSEWLKRNEIVEHGPQNLTVFQLSI